jgi:4-amino-4-deoxy-L-arabinose transferase-like glycosyltransferase
MPWGSRSNSEPLPAGKNPSPRIPWGLVAAVLVCVGCLAPFVNKAFTVDDPLFLWAAQQIRSHPDDPYGFTVSWYGTPMRMADVTKNPPLMPYALALAAALFGWSETALHLICLLPAAGAAWGTYRLAQELCSRPLLASLTAILTPVFLVSSTNVMCDTLMLCWWVWAVVCWRRGLRQPAWFFVAAVLICLCALTKYFGAALVPLLLVYTLAARLQGGWRRSLRTLLPAVAALAVPVAVLAGYQVLTRWKYGNGLLLDAVGFSVGWRGANSDANWASLIGLIFIGGCLAGVLFYLPLLWPRRVLGTGAAVAVGLLTPALLLGRLDTYALSAAAATTKQAGFAVDAWCLAAQCRQTMACGPAAFALGVAAAVSEAPPFQGWDWLAVLQAAVFVLGGLGVVALIVTDLWRRWDANALLLFLWAVGTAAFAVRFNWVINGRSLLPLAPVVGILVARRLDLLHGPSTGRWSWGLAWPLIGAGVVAVMVTAADYRQADADRSAARLIAADCAGRRGQLWLEGHWGFQYYMQRLGGVHVDVYAYHFREGDLLVLPGNNYGVLYRPPPWTARDVLTVEMHGFPWLTTLRLDRGAGFYSHEIGPFPFLIGPSVPVQYCVVEFLEAVGGQPRSAD